MPDKNSESKDPLSSAKSSVTDLSNANMRANESGASIVLLEAGREVRAKLYLGRIFLGWFWFIPVFHMPPPPSDVIRSGEDNKSRVPTHVTLSRKEIDFPVGAGAALIDVDIVLEWATVSSSSRREDNGPVKSRENFAKEVSGPPKLQESGESLDEPAPADSALAAAVQVAVLSGAAGEAAEAVKAAHET